MTKTVEALRRPILKEDVLTGHIANTYFYQRTRPRSRRKKARIPFKGIALKASIAILIIAAIAAFFVTVLSFLNNTNTELLRRKFAKAKFVKIIDGGIANKEIVKKYDFYGYAKNDVSKTLKDAAILNSPKKYNWAAMAIDFKFPVDMSSRRIALSLRGNIGGEKVCLRLRDHNNKSSGTGDLYLSSRWKEEAISLDSMKNDIDLSGITQIRIESGYAGESGKMLDSPINFKIYVKDVNITKETRI